MSSVHSHFFSATSVDTVEPMLTTPEEDAYLSVQFSARSLSKRKDNKKQLLQELAKDKADLKKPLVILLPGLFTVKKDRTLLEDLMPGLQKLNATILILASNKSCNQDMLQWCTQLEANEKNIHQALAAGDIVITPPNGDQSFTQSCLGYGIVPVAPVANGVQDYDPIWESGNGFIYQDYSVWSVFAAIVRALETFKLPYDWQRIQKNGMEGLEK
ncbi:MAG: hypothetical protein HY817_00240 [Candidatus Abawacabacteria bacterium]|nr:hypothetical protein [Candidatus Abawacabacteria bacterium]